MRTSILRTAVVVGAALVSSGVALASANDGPLTTERAEAVNVYYCGFLVPPKSRCSDGGGYNHWQGNRATYPGQGVVNVCERADGSLGIVSRRCANGTVASGSDLPAAGYQFIYVGNNDDGRHTVNGKGVY